MAEKYLTEKQLAELVVRLFESKIKQYSKTTIKVWVDELKYFSTEELITNIKMAIFNEDNFPNIGKITKGSSNPLIKGYSDLRYEYEQFKKKSIESGQKELPNFRQWKAKHDIELKRSIDKLMGRKTNTGLLPDGNKQSRESILSTANSR